MSATDTKETPTPRTDGIMFYVGSAIKTESTEHMLTFRETVRNGIESLEEDLTAVTAQRDRALGLLERAIGWVEDSAYTYGEESSDPHCIACKSTYDHRPGCSIKQLLAEYEALRKELK